MLNEPKKANGTVIHGIAIVRPQRLVALGLRRGDVLMAQMSGLLVWQRDERALKLRHSRHSLHREHVGHLQVSLDMPRTTEPTRLRMPFVIEELWCVLFENHHDAPKWYV